MCLRIEDRDSNWAELFPEERAGFLGILVDLVALGATAGEVEIKSRSGG